MMPIDEMEEMLDEVACEIPGEIYNELNGGVILLPDAKLHPESVGNDLYIMGEYNRSRSLGRYIVIYYGSFSRVFGHLSKDGLKDELRKTLKHELRHHLESMAGERELEYEDEADIMGYLGGTGR
jgi:hypothetical protein